MNFNLILVLIGCSLSLASSFGFDDEDEIAPTETNFKQTQISESYIYKFYRKNHVQINSTHHETINEKSTYLDNKPRFQVFIDFRLSNNKIKLILNHNKSKQEKFNEATILYSNDSFKTYDVAFDSFSQIQAKKILVIEDIQTYQDCYEKCANHSNCYAFTFFRNSCELLEIGSENFECKVGQKCGLKRVFSDEIYLDFEYQLQLCFTVKVNGEYAINAVCPSISVNRVENLVGNWKLHPSDERVWKENLKSLAYKNSSIGRFFLVDKSIFSRNILIERVKNLWKIKNLLFKNNTLEFEINKKGLQSTDIFGNFWTNSSITQENEVKITLSNLNNDKLDEELVLHSRSYKWLLILLKIKSYNIDQYYYYKRDIYADF